MSGSSLPGGLNVAAKPFVPSFGSSSASNSSSRLNPTARAFVPSFDTASTATTATPAPQDSTVAAGSSTSSPLSTAAPSFVPSSTPASASASDAAATAALPSPAAASSAAVPSSSSAASIIAPSSSRPPLDPLLSSLLPLPAPSSRRSQASASSAKVRKPKSLQDEDDSAADRRSAQSYTARHGNHHNSALAGLGVPAAYGQGPDKGEGRGRASAQYGDNAVYFGTTGGSGPLPDGGLRQYSIDELLSFRSLALSQQYPLELDDGCEAIVGGYSSGHSGLNGSASHNGGSNGTGSLSKRQSGSSGNDSFRSSDKDKDSGANSVGWRDNLSNAPPPADADSATTSANTGSSSAAAASNSTASLRPALSLRPSTSLRPGVSAQSSVGRLQAKQASFQPHDKQQGGGQQQGGRGNAGGGGQQRDGGGYRGKGKDAPMDITVAPLEKTERRYTVVKDIPPDTKLLRALQSILNKLTPEKFDTLLEQVLALKISGVGLLRDVVTAIFEKALAEPNFSPTYAQFCVVLSDKLPTFADDEGEQTFRKLILNRCQVNTRAGRALKHVATASPPRSQQET